jgi:hypothetical protein
MQSVLSQRQHNCDWNEHLDPFYPDIELLNIDIEVFDIEKTYISKTLDSLEVKNLNIKGTATTSI